MSAHLIAARRDIMSAMADPDAAATLLDRATRVIDRALRSVGPGTPDREAAAVVREAEELFAIMGCFEEAA